MTKIRVHTEQGETLFYGTLSRLSTNYVGWHYVEYSGPFAGNIDERLNRINQNWSRNRNAQTGAHVYHLPPIFHVEKGVEDEPEVTGAPKGNPTHPDACTCHSPAREGTPGKFHATRCPDQPSNLTGPDPYTTIIDVNFAFEGERFRAEETRGGKKYVRYGTFAMDGNAISPDFGWLTFLEKGEDRTYEAKLKAYGPESGKQYINVHYDDQPAGYYDDFKPKKTRGREVIQEAVPAGAGWPNEGLHPDKPGLKIYGLPEVAARKGKKVAQVQQAKKVRDAEQRVRDARDELRRAESALRQAEKSGTVES